MEPGRHAVPPAQSPTKRAAIAAGFLLATAGSAAPVAAQEPDRTQEGTAPPEAPADPEADAPTFDPGGDTTLPLDVGPTPNVGGGEDTGVGAPLDAEPIEDPDAPDPSPESDGAPAPTDGETPTPPGEEDPAAPSADLPTQPGTPPTAPPDASRPQTQHLEAEARPILRSAARLTRRAGVPPPIGQPVQPPANGPDEALRLAGSQTTRQSDAAASELVVNTRARTTDADSGDVKVHVVQPGESLWAIAADLLGSAASPARLAREVRRLWSLNEARIGTGDPDLLMVGTELRLR
jgi:LysM domain